MLANILSIFSFYMINICHRYETKLNLNNRRLRFCHNSAVLAWSLIFKQFYNVTFNRFHVNKCSLKRLKLHLFWNCSHTVTLNVTWNLIFNLHIEFLVIHDCEKERDTYFIKLISLLANYNLRKCKLSKMQTSFF